MSTRSPRNGHALGLEQRALARALGERAVGAHDPVPRHARVVAGGQHGAREARRAGRHVAVGAHEAGRVCRRMRSSTARHAEYRAAYPRAMRHGTYSIVALDPGDGRARRGGAVALVLRRLAVHVGAAGRRRRRDPVGRRARHGPHALDRLAAGEDAAAGARRAAGRRPARRRPPGRRRRRARAASRSTPARTASPHAGHAAGEHWTLPGQHDGPRHRPGRDVGRLRGAQGDARRAAAGRARGRRGRRRRRPRAPVGRAARRARRRASRGRRASTCASRTTRTRSASCGGCCASIAPTNSGRGRRADGRGPRRRGGRTATSRAAELAPGSDELLFWSGLALAQAGELDRGVDAVRRAATVHEGWLTLLDRLAPDFAPAGTQVRRALGR